MTGPRRLSQAISEGDGISLIAKVRSAEEAHALEDAGAEGVAITEPVSALREATPLPILWHGGGSPEAAEAAGADAFVIAFGAVAGDEHLDDLHAAVFDLGLELVAEVRDEEELELALEHLDPEIFLLSSAGAEDDEEPLERVLDLLPDVPAGKLAIATVPGATRDDVQALERAGIDGVLVEGRDVSGLASVEPPEV